MRNDFHLGLLPERLQSKIRIDWKTGCWLWAASCDSSGYGKIRFEGNMCSSHRLFYELLIGRIPKNREIDHLCRVRHCVNPEHMEPVTDRENSLRGKRNQFYKKSHCIHGHEFTPENTYVWAKRPTQRGCRICLSERNQRQHKNLSLPFPLKAIHP
jgi:hypothetical protein